jgi:hypothetical protein
LWIRSTLSINIFSHRTGQYNAAPAPKVYVDQDMNLFIDHYFEVIYSLPDFGCSDKMDFDYDKCYIKDAGEQMNTHTYGCILPFYGNIEYGNICNSGSENWKKIMTDFHPMTIAVDKCVTPCINDAISYGFPYLRESFQKSEIGYTTVYYKFRRMIAVKKMVYTYDLISMVAEIGGYSGLLLGVSLLDLSKIVHKYFIH